MIPLIKQRKKYALKMEFSLEDTNSQPLQYPPEVGGAIAHFPSLKGSIVIPQHIYLSPSFVPQLACYTVHIFSHHTLTPTHNKGKGRVEC